MGKQSRKKRERREYKLNDKALAVIQGQKDRFIAKFGREPGPHRVKKLVPPSFWRDILFSHKGLDHFRGDHHELASDPGLCLGIG